MEEKSRRTRQVDRRANRSLLRRTIVLMAVLVPWSTAVVVPLAAIGAPLTCILAAFYLYLVPLWNACTALVSRHAQNMAAKGRAARCS